ncbi:multidrug effflux MFS transporter [Xylophilus sp.]|uniref:multidrug effflux MFS transporter n=1 Tax=Xylophilus sp. TaxID=2653893 RepID=UPI0013B82AD4|nr:multidrug effflux MFS transporter [Xylophilus sp.]KAF1048737.1 MAG: Bicyclomycin resistance protein [Xylophilus sp.]
MALLLGLLSAIGPFAIDRYLPALPSIGAGFGVGAGQVQLSLTAFFASFSVAQLVFGPAADRWGRRVPMLAGLAVFALGSVGCALASDIGALVAFRFVQGLGAAATAVVPRAVVRDLHTGHEAARLTALLMLVFSVSPILAPLAGSGLTSLAGWRSVFWAVLAAAVAGLAAVVRLLPETLPQAGQARGSLLDIARAYRQLLGDRHFMALSCIGGLGVASFFAYLANSSFVLISHYGLTPARYSLAFGLNAASFIGTSQFAAGAGRRFGLKPVVRRSAAGCALVMCAPLGLWILGLGSLPLLMGMLFLGYGFLGFVIPLSAVLTMDDQGAAAGTAAALMGTLHLGLGAVAIGLVSPFADAGAQPMLAAIAASAVGAWLLAEGTLRPRAGVRRAA